MKSPISVTISGETVRPIVGAIVDLFSPVTEPLGWIGDLVRDQRMRSALTCFGRAKEVAEKAGVKLKAPPAKFLSQFVDCCSLENDSDKQLIEWWARLLVDAGSDFQGKHIFYTNILKQITSRELDHLECLVRNGKGSYPLEFAGEAEFTHDFDFDIEGIALTDKLTDRSAKNAAGSIKRKFERPGLLVLDLFIDDENSNQHQEFHPDYSDDELASWQVLQSLQLVRLSYHRFSSGKVEYRVRSALITELGAQFYFSCHEAGFGKRNSTKTRYKRVRTKDELKKSSKR